MDELARTKVEDERDEIVALLRTIADRLHALTPPETRVSLERLASSVAMLAQEAEPMIGPLPVVTRVEDDPDPPGRATVVYVRRGSALGA
jgi:hypothetical protein